MPEGAGILPDADLNMIKLELHSRRLTRFFFLLLEVLDSLTCSVDLWRAFYSHAHFKPCVVSVMNHLSVTRVHINLFCVYFLLFCSADSGVSLSAAGEENKKYGALCCHAERDGLGQCNCCHFYHHPPILISPARPIRSTLRNGVNLGFTGRLAAQAYNWSVRMKPRPNSSYNLLWKPFQSYR